MGSQNSLVSWIGIQSMAEVYGLLFSQNIGIWKEQA